MWVLGRKAHPQFMIMHEKWVHMKAIRIVYIEGERFWNWY
jgi:hypothetical protein